MKIKNPTTILFAALLAACGARSGLAAEAGKTPESRQEKTAAAAQPAPQPASAVQPVRTEIKIEKLDLPGAVKEISLADPQGTAELYRVAGEIYVRTQKLDKAISLLETYRQQGGANQTILYTLGGLYTQRNANKEAAEVYESLLKLYPDAPGPATTMLIDLYRQLGDFKKAAGLMEAVAKANPENPDIFVQMGSFYMGQNDLAKAEEAFRKAAALSPRPEYYKQLAQLIFRQGSLEKAVAALEEGGKKTPESEAELTLAISDLYLQTGQADKALAALENCVRRQPGSEIELTLAISDVYVRKAQADKAEAVLKALLEKTRDPLKKAPVQQKLDALRLAAMPAAKAMAPVGDTTAK